MIWKFGVRSATTSQHELEQLPHGNAVGVVVRSPAALSLSEG